MDSLFFHNHQYDDAGEAPCPLEGCEDGQLATKTKDGKLAWWWRGRLFVRNDAKSQDNASTMEWERKTRNG